jgi:hypothetical protein
MRFYVFSSAFIVAAVCGWVLLKPAEACGEYGCAGQVCGNGLTCVHPCACFDNGTGPGRCISP